MDGWRTRGTARQRVCAGGGAFVGACVRVRSPTPNTERVWGGPLAGPCAGLSGKRPRPAVRSTNMGGRIFLARTRPRSYGTKHGASFAIARDRPSQGHRSPVTGYLGRSWLAEVIILLLSYHRLLHRDGVFKLKVKTQTQGVPVVCPGRGGGGRQLGLAQRKDRTLLVVASPHRCQWLPTVTHWSLVCSARGECGYSCSARRPQSLEMHWRRCFAGLGFGAVLERHVTFIACFCAHAGVAERNENGWHASRWRSFYRLSTFIYCAS
ncbi:hypothetical protein EDB86DRAFT_1943698 [Lactarius hatsudake]|nr:hypothetical protein EDB86DRAFT_1943698 [Lactarius hatsudake]